MGRIASSTQYFDKVWKRFAWASTGWCRDNNVLAFELDRTIYVRLVFGLYLRTYKSAQEQPE